MSHPLSFPRTNKKHCTVPIYRSTMLTEVSQTLSYWDKRDRNREETALTSLCSICVQTPPTAWAGSAGRWTRQRLPRSATLLNIEQRERQGNCFRDEKDLQQVSVTYCKMLQFHAVRLYSIYREDGRVILEVWVEGCSLFGWTWKKMWLTKTKCKTCYFHSFLITSCVYNFLQLYCLYFPLSLPSRKVASSGRKKPPAQHATSTINFSNQNLTFKAVITLKVVLEKGPQCDLIIILIVLGRETEEIHVSKQNM